MCKHSYCRTWTLFWSKAKCQKRRISIDKCISGQGWTYRYCSLTVAPEAQLVTSDAPEQKLWTKPKRQSIFMAKPEACFRIRGCGQTNS
eukprot:Skav225746  [mRNA]  locus=scaffold28:105334:107607:- [translate_table: standard]